jgi:hypothetical protein
MVKEKTPKNRAVQHATAWMNFKDDKLTDNYVKPDTIEMYQVIR